MGTTGQGSRIPIGAPIGTVMGLLLTAAVSVAAPLGGVARTDPPDLVAAPVPVGRLPVLDGSLRSEIVGANDPDVSAKLPVSDPDPLLADARRRAGEVLEGAQDFNGAADAYAAAVLAGDVVSLRDLARVRALAGAPAAAEAAYLAAVDAVPPGPGWRGEVLTELGELYLGQGRAAEAVATLEWAQRLLPGSDRVSNLLLAARMPLDLERAGSGGREVVWPPSPPRDWRDDALGWLPDWVPELSPEVRRELDWRFGVAAPASPGRAAIIMVFLGLALLGLFIFLRQRGDMAVTIEYPEELRGTFHVRLSRHKSRLAREARLGRSAILKGGTSSRTEHHLVSRETLFPRLLTGRYQVTVEGILRSPDSGAVLADCFERREIKVLYWRTVRAEFDVRPETCPVEVVALWDDRPARDVSVAVWGHPESLSSSRGAPVTLQLSKGHHRLAVGSGDRVVLADVDVETYLPTRVVLDLGRSEEVVFKGCPPAVEPYLVGDVSVASQALQRDGQHERAQLLLALWHQDENRLDAAAEHFERAEHSLAAAQLWSERGEHRRAAGLYAKAGKPLLAAEMYRDAGELVEAGVAYEAALDFDNAIACYRESGEVGRWIDALERSGSTFAAAQAAFEHGERSRGIRLLLRIGVDEPEHARACMMLADSYEQDGHWDLAAQKLEEYIATGGPETRGTELYARLAGLLEEAGFIERSLEMLEDLRRRDPAHPNLAARIELLRKQRSASRGTVGLGSGGRVEANTPTVLLTEKRYEVLREIGRGGMGVVYQARDTRLGRVVALKQLPEKLIQEHPDSVQRFLHEAQAAAQLNHPNIVTVYDTDQQDGVFFITMEMLIGESLQSVLRKDGRLPERKVVQLALQIAAGLEYAHQRGVVHRDIKTANLFLTSEDVVKVMDFGLAKMLEEVRRESTLLGGTPFYMSPEQVRGDIVDHRCDLYGMGVTLYELATGQVPFYEGEVAYHHCHTEPVDPRRRVSGISDAFAELVLQLLAKDPEDRCASASEVGLRLETLIQD